jgi:tRNA G18 (ribose-2'-O)-methylase SpoU
MKLLKPQDIQLVRKKNKSSNAPILVCDNMQYPENIASIFRLSDAMGVNKLIFLTPKNFNPKCRKFRSISRSCSDKIPYESISLDEFIASKLNIPLVAVDLIDDATDITDTKLPQQCYLVFGNESSGISGRLMELIDSAVFIPMFGDNNSMNVTHAASIVLYEWRRQHGSSN